MRADTARAAPRGAAPAALVGAFASRTPRRVLVRATSAMPPPAGMGRRFPPLPPAAAGRRRVAWTRAGMNRQCAPHSHPRIDAPCTFNSCTVPEAPSTHEQFPVSPSDCGRPRARSTCAPTACSICTTRCQDLRFPTFPEPRPSASHPLPASSTPDIHFPLCGATMRSRPGARTEAAA